MADLNIALILRLVDRATAPARAAMRAIERIGGDSLMRQADRVNAGARLMGAGLTDVGTAAMRGGAMVTAYGAGMAALAASFVRPAAQFEMFNVQLTTLEGSAAGAEKAMGWIEEFATRTPLSVEETVRAYARLKAFGLDPTTGSLQAMVDTMAATGGGAEQMDGLTLALGQAWTKGKLQGEEAMQMLERGVPVWDLLAQQMGKSAAEVQKLSEQGRLGREEITLLMEALGSKYDGASERASETWDGIISNLWDQWTRFQRLVMGSGLFIWMKSQLQQLLDVLNTMAANGELQAWAEAVGQHILRVLSAIRDFGAGLYRLWADDIFPALDSFQQMVGGWDVVGWIALGAAFSGTLANVAIGIALIAKGLLLLSANPVVLLALAFAGLAYVIYSNWDGIVTYFSEKLDAIALMLTDLKDTILSVFDIDFLAIGSKWITDLWAGIGAQIDAMITWVQAKFAAMMPTLPDWMTPDGPAPAGEGGYGGRGDTVQVLASPPPRLRQRGAPNRSDVPTAPVTIGTLNVNAAPGQSPQDVAMAVRRELADMAQSAPLHDGGMHAE